MATSDLIAATSRQPRRGDAELFPRRSIAPHQPYWQREDPFYDDWLWERQPNFKSPWVWRRRADGSYTKGSTLLDPRTTDGKRRWTTTKRSVYIHRLLALLAQLSHATTKQATCWGGWHRSAATRHTRPPHELGLTQQGWLNPRILGGGRLPWLWRPNPDGPWPAWLRDADETLASEVIGDRRRVLRRPGEHVRHDVLAVEAALRLLETQPRWVAVSGEAHANLAALTGDGTYPTQLRGDLVLWRDDGLRVIVELTASADPRHLSHKIAAWGQAMARRTLAETGTIVVLLNAVAEGHYAAATRLRQVHQRQLDVDTVRDGAGVVLAPDELREVRGMIHLASWADWFPEPRRVGARGTSAVSTTSVDGKHWRAWPLAEPDSVDYRPLRAAQVPAPPTGSLLTPWWAGRADRDAWHDADPMAGRDVA